MYSQSNEEKIILDYFKGFTGTFLDCGANDGRTFSNSLALIERGWKGSLIEASPKAFEKLQKEHEGKGLELNNIALASSNGYITLYESGSLLGKNDVALVSSAVDSEVRRWDSLNLQFEEIDVPCLSFKSFLKLSAYKTFDFISIDIEGMELIVLPQMDFEKLGTKMVCVEFNGKHEQRFKEIMKGFKLVHKNAENLIFAK